MSLPVVNISVNTARRRHAILLNVSDLPSDDLSREIDRLWARVGSTSSESTLSSPSVNLVGSGGDVAWETVSLLKRQHRLSEANWRQTMEASEETLRLLRARLQAAEAELSELRGRSESDGERLMIETLDARQKIEAAQKAIALAEARHTEERRVLEAAMQNLRERLAAETSRARTAEQRWQAREQQYLLDLKELQGLAERRESDATTADKVSRTHQAALAEAKNALEKTLSELLVERKEGQRAQAEREAALKKVEELRAHVDELSRIWEEERGQWRELWDRERSSWESKRVELAQWEENLRREREAWHADLQAKEATHVALTEDLSVRIRETAQNAEKMSHLISSFDRKSAEDSARVLEETTTRVAMARERAASRKRWTVAAVFLLVLGAGAVPGWRAATQWHFNVEAVAPAPSPNPSALAFDGGALWIADWSGKLISVDAADPHRVLRQVEPAPPGAYRPTAIAVGTGVLWTLDAAQARLIRHSAAAPEKILSVRPSPGPAPAALAFDGETVWSYDALDRTLTRHGGDDSSVQAYSFPDDVVPNAMAWLGGQLWINDAKGRNVIVYALEQNRLKKINSQPMTQSGVIGLAATASGPDRRAYMLFDASGARSKSEIVRYQIKRLLPFAHF